MEHSKIVDQRRIELERTAAETAKALENLNNDNLEKRFQRRKELLEEVKAIESELVAILGVSADALFGGGKPAKVRATSERINDSTEATRKQRRKSLTEEEKLVKIAELLRGNPKGLSAKEITDKTGDTYNTVSEHLSKHTERYVKSGKKRATVYMLKE
jgi:DNA-binding transcriptional ArsR family regulator